MPNELSNQGVEMLNTATQQVEYIPPESAAEAYLSGKYAIDLDSNYDLVGLGGERANINGQALKKALVEGYDFENAGQKEERRLRDQYGDNSVEAFAEGTARGLTFGLSDWTLKKLGVSEERLREIKERNRVASAAGELTGVVAPLLATGGTSAVAKGISAVGAAPRAVAATGKAATRVAEKALAKVFGETGATAVASKTLAKAVLEKALPASMGSAVEGAFYGAGQLLSEAALGRSDVNAENLISHVGLGALVGGAVGGLLPIPGVLAKRVIGKIDDTAATIAQKADETAAIVEPKPGETLPPVNSEDIKISKLGGVEPEDVAYFRGNKDRILDTIKTSTLDETAPNRLSDQVLDDLDKFDTHLRGRETQAGELIEQSGFALPEKDVLGIFREKIKEIKGSGKKGTESGADAVKRLNDYIKRNKSKAGDEIWDAKRIRQFMQGLWEDNKKFYVPGREALFEERAIGDVAAKLNETIKGGVGDNYRALMEAYAPEVEAMKRLRKEWKLTNENVPQMQGWFKNRFQYHMQQKIEGVRQEVDPIISAINTMGRSVGKDYEQVVKDNLIFGRLFPEQAKGLQKGSLTHAVGRLVGSVMHGDLTSFVKDIAFQGGKEAAGSIRQQVYQDLLSGQPSLFSRAVGGAYESVVVNKLGAIERILKQQSSKISDGVDNYLSKSNFSKAAVPVSTKALLEVTFGDDDHKPKDRREALKMRRAELNLIINNPNILADKLAERIGGISQAAPETANAMMQTAIKAVQFLHSKAPQPPAFEDSIMPATYDWHPSDDELASYERYVRAANDPMSVVDDMKRGQLTTEGVETLKAIYPNIYDQILGEMKKQVVDKGKELPYSKKLQLEYLFGTSLDFSTKQQSVMMLQDTYKATQQQPPQAPRTSQNVSFAQNSMTDTQRVINRR